MPNRIIKESVCVSETINRLSDFEENFFYRLIVNCDDYGRFDGRIGVLMGRMYPIRSRVKRTDAEKALKTLEEVGLITMYTVDGHPYIQMNHWSEHQRVRTKRAKFPAMDGDGGGMTADDSDLTSNDSRCRPESESESKSESESETERANESNPNPPAAEKEGMLSLAELKSLPSGVQGAVLKWMAYKQERGERFGKTAREEFLRSVRENCRTMGEKAAAEAILSSIAATWKSVVWRRPKTTGPPAEEREPTYDLDEFMKLMEGADYAKNL